MGGEGRTFRVALVELVACGEESIPHPTERKKKIPSVKGIFFMSGHQLQFKG
jgi:hypothetical protein